jgi:hypothetical protein
MREDRPLLTLLTIVIVVALGYVAYTISAGVHPGPALPASALPQAASALPQDRDR